MRRLLLLRHAKSEWPKAGREAGAQDDHERPLNGRGRAAAPRVGKYMHAKGYLPALILCSTAARARETLDRLLPDLGAPPPVRYEASLYLAEWPHLLAMVRAAPAGASPLLLIGHNPGIEQLALALSLRPRTAAERARAEALARKFPTGGLAVLEFTGSSWRSVKPGGGRLIDFVQPKDLVTAAGGEDSAD